MTSSQLAALPLIADFDPALMAANQYRIAATLNGTHVLAIRDTFHGCIHEAESAEGQEILSLCRAVSSKHLTTKMED